MSDLSKMIDETTKRLLKKIDNWEVPQSDKEYVTIEKEVWESTLRISMERAGKIETLQKQLSEIKDAYIDLTTQDEYGSYYIEEAKDFVDTVGRILKEAGLLQELNK